MWVAAAGYLAFVLVVAALITRQVVRLRVLWLAAGAALVLYGIGLGQAPVALTGIALAVANLWRLGRELGRTGPAPEIAAIPIEPQHPFLQDFLRGNLADIQRSQPGFSLDDEPEFVRLITRNGLPAGVFIARPLGDELDIVLDYVTPRYRDSRSGRWLFGEGAATFTSAGFKRLVAAPVTYEHQTYLEQLGFRPEGSKLVKEL